MGEGPTPTGMAGTAADPGADPETLRQIAFHYPDLRPVVAANPSAYQGLLDWLAALGDPRIDAALAARGGQGGAGADASGRGGAAAPVFAPASAAAAAASAGAGATPAQGVPSTSQAGGGRNNRGTRIALVILLVAALVLIAIVWAIFRDASGGTGESGQSSAAPQPTQTSSSPSSSPSASPTPSASPSEEIRFPAPAGAVAASAVVTPSGNIACELQPDSVTCSIVEQSYAQNGLQDCEGQPFALVADAKSAERACGKAVSGTGAELPYGTAAVNGHSVCVSDTEGVSCWNTVSGQSFALARQGWQTGNTGHIEPANFLW